MKPSFSFNKIYKKIIIIFLIGLAVILLLVFFIFVRKSDTPATDSQSWQAQETLAPTEIRILATGDWIAHDAINKSALNDNNYDYSSMLEPMKPYFKAADINFCNLATPAGGEQFGISGYPVFNAPLQWNRDMHSLGCNLINTGTNHTNDKGQDVIDAELNEWGDYSDVLALAGANRSAAEQQEIKLFEVNGVKFAFLSYSTYSNSPNPQPFSLNHFVEPLVTNQMTEARAQADIVIVSMRWGTEYSAGINAAQTTAAAKLADLGADIVLGHGQHVLGPVKRLPAQGGREAIVWYGLGNFLNAQLETEALTGCIATFTVNIATKELTESTCLPIYQHYEWTVEAKSAERLLERRNFQLMPLYNASKYLARPDAHLNTTVDEQLARLRDVLNTYTNIPIQSADDL